MFGPARLREALRGVEAWSLPSTFTQTHVHHGYRRVVLIESGHWLPAADRWRFVLDTLAPVHSAWLSWIDPGGFIVPHRDAGPWRERWQVPIQAAGDFHAAETFSPTDGVPFPVTHWREHSVTNRTDRPRIHLVIDRDVWLPEPAAPFALFGIPESMTDLVSAAN